MNCRQLEELVRKIGNFYCYTDLGMIDKSENLRQVEERVSKLLNENRYRKCHIRTRRD